MKRVVLLIITVSVFGFAGELKTVYSYSNALYKAKKEHKLVLVMMSYSGCPICDYMKQIVLERPNVLAYLNDHFYVVIKDLQKDHYPERFAVIDAPTFFFIDPLTGKDVIPRKSGGFRPGDFLTLLHEATGEPMQRVTTTTETNTRDTNRTDTNKTIAAASPKQRADINSSLAPCHNNMPCTEPKKITIN